MFPTSMVPNHKIHRKRLYNPSITKPYPNEFGYANEPNKKSHRIANKGQYPGHVSLASQDFSKILSLGI